VLLRLRSRPHPALLECFRALEQEDKLLLVLGGPLPSPSPSCFSDPEVGNAAMAILAELWAARNEALTAKMAVLAPGPARGTLLAYFPREQAVAARQLEPEAPPVAPRRLLESRAGKAEWGEFVPLAPVEGEVRGVDEWRHHFRGEVRAAAAPRAAPHAPAPPASYPHLPAGLAGLGSWAAAGRSAVCQSAPPGGMEAHGTPVDLMTFESSADT